MRSTDIDKELTKKQKEFYDIMTDDKTRIVFVGGPAGTAKTFLSVYSALDLYNSDKNLKILYYNFQIFFQIVVYLISTAIIKLLLSIGFASLNLKIAK